MRLARGQGPPSGGTLIGGDTVSQDAAVPAMQAGSNTVYDQPPSVSGPLDHLDVATEPTFKGGDAPRYGEIDMASPHTPAQPLTASPVSSAGFGSVRSGRMGQGSFSTPRPPSGSAGPVIPRPSPTPSSVSVEAQDLRTRHDGLEKQVQQLQIGQNRTDIAVRTLSQQLAEQFQSQMQQFMTMRS